MLGFATRMRILFVIALVLAGCHREPQPMHPKEGELPPLPPASGTAVGYLVDNASQLKLREEQLSKLKEIDASLSARNDQLDTQLRIIEKPDEQPAEKGKPPPVHNNAPGAQVKTTPEAAKLRDAKAANDRDALVKAFAVLDPPQLEIAKRLLDERGIALPGAKPKQNEPSPEDGVPLEP
jgi:hypothetical protein